MKRILALLLVLMLCVALASCGSKSDSKSGSKGSDSSSSSAVSDETTAIEEKEVPEETEAPEETTAPEPTQADVGSKKYATVGEYLEDPSVKAQIETTKETTSGMGMTIDVYADGDDTLVYDYTYQQHFSDAQISAAKTQLDTQLENYESTFMTVVSELEKNIDQPEPKVKVIYRNDDGAVITSKTYQR